MAERNWVRPGLLAVLLMCASAAVGAQTAAVAAGGTLTGKLTDLHSTPLDGATVVVRNEGTGAQVQAKTQKNGSFRFSGLDPGAYTVEAESARLGRGRLEGVVVSAGHEAHVQAAMAFEPVARQPDDKAIDSVAIPPVDPLRELASIDNRTAELSRERTKPETEVVSDRLDGETILRLPLTSRSLPDGTPVMDETEAQVLNGALTDEPLKALSLSGHDAPEAANAGGAGGGHITSPAAVGGSAVVEAAAVAARAAIASVQAGAGQAPTTTGHVDPVTEAVATTVTAAELQTLPAAGRRWQDFVLDTPTAATAAGGLSPTVLRGAGKEPPETRLDGVNTRMAFGEQGSTGSESQEQESSGQGGSSRDGTGPAWAGGHGSPVAEAAIREVETVAGNAELEGARAAGGQVSVETARGTNGLHGQGFLFDRQNTWGAQNPFTQWVTETSPATLNYNQSPVLSVPIFDNGPNGPPQSYTPPDHEMVWGIGLGSQIRRDKLFWFGALDSYHRKDPGLSMVKWPYAWQIPSNCQAYSPCTPTLGGFFATPSDGEAQVLSARLGLSSVNPVVEGLTAYSPMLESLAGLLGPAPRTATQWVGFGRLDWQAAERHRFTLEGIGATWNSPGGGLTRVSENYGDHSLGSSEASEEWLLGRWEAFLTPNLLAVTQGSAGRNILAEHAETPSAFEQTFLGPNAYGQLPQIVVDNRYGFTIGNPSQFGPGSYPDERLYEGQETVNWVRGSLLVKAGFDLSHSFDATSLLRNETGTYTYSDVENFASDALVFAKYGPNPDGWQNTPAGWQFAEHNCDPTGKAWQASNGQLMGRGALPCYSHYSQMIGPTNWNLSTNDWAGYAMAQWQPSKLAVFSIGLRWEREQLPPPLPLLNNTELPLTEKLPSLGNDWGPRISLALGSLESHWPVLRLGYGMYYGRTENSTVETALTQTGSLNGDLSFFLRPTDGYASIDGTSSAPFFPYVLRGPPGSVVKPGAVEFAPGFRNPEVHQSVVAVEEALPGHVEVTASALLSLGRRLPVYIETNIDTNPADTGSITYAVCDETAPAPNSGACGNLGLGPIKATKITVPFYASWPSGTESTVDCPNPVIVTTIGWLNPCYQGIEEITSKANSTYEAVMLKVVRYGRRGLSLHAHYTYSHAMDWNPGESPLDPNPADFRQEYGAGDQDMRHSAAAMVVYEAPWKLHNRAGRLANGWMLSGIGQFHSGLPYSMRVSGSLPECGGYPGSCTPPQSSGVNVTPGDYIVGLRPGMIGSRGDNRVYWEGSEGIQTIGRNTYRYPATWKADVRLGKTFDLGQMRQLELLMESFNLFNHQNVTEIETTGYSIESGTASSPPTLNFLTGLKINSTTGLPDPAFGKPLNINATDFYRERQFQVGLRMRF
jgi:hypothetical protein